MTTKNLTYIIILISIIGCSKTNEKTRLKNNLYERNLIGKIKSVKSELFEYYIKDDSLIIGKKMNSYSSDRNETLEFNELGLITSKIEFYSNNKVSNEKEYLYDDNNRLQEITEIDHYGKKSIISDKFYYNQNDSLVRIEYRNDDFERIMLIERNEKNQFIKRTDKVKDTVQMTFTFQYDNNGNIIKENSYLKSDIPAKLITRKFKNNHVKFEDIIQFYEYDTVKHQNIFEYDKEQRVSKSKSYFENENSYILTINSYHNNSKLKEQMWKPIGAVKYFISIRKWDIKGNLIEHSREDNETGEKDIWNYKYKFDKVGNWITKENYKDDKPSKTIIKREIKYYD